MTTSNGTQSSEETSEPEVRRCDRDGVQVSNADILASLCIDAEAVSIDVRNCIRLYDEKCTTLQLTNLFKPVNKETLSLTLDFLRAPTPIAEKSWNDYLKPTCIRELIVRIQNLLIDTCGFCKENYASQREDKCYLKCCYCGQFAHEKCLRNILGEKFNENMNETEVHDIIFPFKLNCYYFCHECSDKQVPQNTTGLKKVAAKPKPSQALGPPPQNSHVIDTESLNADVIDTHHELDTQHEHDNNILDNRRIKEDLPKEGDGQALKSKLCRFYAKGICKFGKKGELCKFNHPVYCKPLLNYGPKSEKGCNKGQNCQHFHPKMCHSSISRHECFKEKCPYFHIKGTRRVRPTRKNDDAFYGENNYVPSERYQNQQNLSQSNSAPNSSHIKHDNHSQDFLAMFNQLREELFTALDRSLKRALPLANSRPYLGEEQFPPLPSQQMTAPQLQPQPFNNQMYSNQQTIIPQPNY